MKIFRLLLGMIVLSVYPGFAAETPKSSKVPAPPPLPTVKRKPIVMKWETIGGIRYYFSGIQIKDHDSLVHVIEPLNDPDANQLLSDSKHSGDASVFWLVSGCAVMVGGLVLVGTDPNVTNHQNVVDGQEVAGLVICGVGLVGGYVGLFKMIDSKAEEFEAIQRYNAVIHGDDLDAFHPIHRNGLNADLLTFKF